jgi:long-subunit fatty acid transport protein
MFRRALVAVLVCWGAAAWADGIHLNGISPRSIGRAGTNLGFADNGGILFDNPAGAVRINGEGLFEVSGGAVITNMSYADDDNSRTHDGGICPLPGFAFIHRPEGGDVAFGFGVFAPAGFSESYQMRGPLPFGGERGYKSFGSLTKIVPSIALQLTDRLSVGGTFGLAVCHAEMEGPYTLQNAGLLTGIPTMMDLQATGATTCFSFGAQYELSEATTFGLAYQSESRFKLDGSTLTTIPLLGQYRFDTDVNVTWPQTLGAGLRHQLDATKVISADVIWFNWEQAFDDLGLTLTSVDFPAITIKEKFPLNWRDSLSVRVGYEQTVWQVHTLRCGYVYHRNPIPASTITPYIQATMEHAVSLGYGRKWGLWEADVAYMVLFAPKVEVDDSVFVGGDFDNATHWANTHYVGVNVIKRY